MLHCVLVKVCNVKGGKKKDRSEAAVTALQGKSCDFAFTHSLSGAVRHKKRTSSQVQIAIFTKQ